MELEESVWIVVRHGNEREDQTYDYRTTAVVRPALMYGGDMGTGK